MIKSREQSIIQGAGLMILWLRLVQLITDTDKSDEIAAIRRRVTRLRRPGG